MKCVKNNYTEETPYLVYHAMHSRSGKTQSTISANTSFNNGHFKSFMTYQVFASRLHFNAKALFYRCRTWTYNASKFNVKNFILIYCCVSSCCSNGGLHSLLDCWHDTWPKAKQNECKQNNPYYHDHVMFYLRKHSGHPFPPAFFTYFPTF